MSDQWTPATTHIVIATPSGKRYWDDLATRTPHTEPDSVTKGKTHKKSVAELHPGTGWAADNATFYANPSGAPLLDWWENVTWPEILDRLVAAMVPQKVCRVCGEPSRRIVDYERETTGGDIDYDIATGRTGGNARMKSSKGGTAVHIKREHAGFTDCGHNDWRPGVVLFVGEVMP